MSEMPSQLHADHTIPQLEQAPGNNGMNRRLTLGDACQLIEMLEGRLELMIQKNLKLHFDQSMRQMKQQFAVEEKEPVKPVDPTVHLKEVFDAIDPGARLASSARHLIFETIAPYVIEHIYDETGNLKPAYSVIALIREACRGRRLDEFVHQTNSEFLSFSQLKACFRSDIHLLHSLNFRNSSPEWYRLHTDPKCKQNIFVFKIYRRKDVRAAIRKKKDAIKEESSSSNRSSSASNSYKERKHRSRNESSARTHPYGRNKFCR